jgi:hypothetical protein
MLASSAPSLTLGGLRGVLRTADAMTPCLTAREAAISLLVFCAVYVFIFSFGTFYIYRLLWAGPVGNRRQASVTTSPESSHGHVLDRALGHQLAIVFIYALAENLQLMS